MTKKKKPMIAELLMQSGIISDMEIEDGDLTFQIETEYGNYRAFGIDVNSAFVIVVYINFSVPDDKDKLRLLKEFIDKSNENMPFGEFLIDKNSELAFKVYLFNASTKDAEDVELVTFWTQDMIASHIGGFHTVIGGYAEPKSVADKIQSDILSRKEDEEE